MPRTLICRYLVLLVALSTAASAGEVAKVLIFRDGHSLRVRSWNRQGAVTRVVDLQGVEMVVRTDQLDFDRTQAASQAEERRVNATPTPTATPKQSIVQAAREAQMAREARLARERAAAQQANPTEAGVAPPPVPATTPEPTPQPTVTPAPTPAPTVVAPVAPKSTPPPSPPVEPASGGSLLLYGLIGAGLAAAGGVAFVLKNRKQGAGARVTRPARPAAAAAEEEELLVPAFAEDPAADDLPSSVEEVAKMPAELPGAFADARSLPAKGQTASVLGHGEIQIRIGADVYTCPDLASLLGWVEEGRVIENSEILAADGTWLMAGSIPDLEAAFASRRDSLGY